MALLDILTGRRGASGRLPPLAMALLGLLAYNKLRKPGPEGERPGSGGALADRLGEFLKPSSTAGDGPSVKGVLGALLTGGLMDLVAQFRGAGKADTVDSWISPGTNRPVSAGDLTQVLTEDQIAFLMERTGMSREELLAGLAERLPQVVDELTPEGRVPTPEEMQRAV